MRDRKKLFRNLAFFVLLIGVTLYILLKDQDFFKMWEILKSVKIQFVFIGLGCILLYVVCEAINIGRTLRSLNEKSTFWRNLKYAFIGFFFSAITPAASGGQPMQIVYMHKDKISVSNATLTLLINLTSMQIITIVFALFSLIFNYKYMNSVLITFFIIGILLNLSALILLLVGIMSKRATNVIINFAIKVMKFFRIKNIEPKRQKIKNELTKYQANAKYVKKNKWLISRTLFTTLIQFTIYYSVTYWTYRALGFREHNIFEIITMQSVLFATVSGIPSPGAVGVTEGAFIEIFKTVYPATMMSSAVLLNRTISFYFLVFISCAVTVFAYFKSGGKDQEIVDVKKDEEPDIYKFEL
ncbi:MAG: flippase-like domain-containing protein [Clostridia bacterium]|nr:flippase-like domain-containing protein [Clostridia bacterium]